MVVDTMENSSNSAYGAYFERLYILQDEKVVYQGGRGPEGYGSRSSETGWSATGAIWKLLKRRRWCTFKADGCTGVFFPSAPLSPAENNIDTITKCVMVVLVIAHVHLQDVVYVKDCLIWKASDRRLLNYKHL